jgi:hypothetical protein
MTMRDAAETCESVANMIEDGMFLSLDSGDVSAIRLILRRLEQLEREHAQLIAAWPDYRDTGPRLLSLRNDNKWMVNRMPQRIFCTREAAVLAAAGIDGEDAG